MLYNYTKDPLELYPIPSQNQSPQDAAARDKLIKAIESFNK